MLVAQSFLNHRNDGTMNLVVDHIDNNKLNNYFKNLQIISNRANCQKKVITKTSKYVGVCYDKSRKKWSSEIRHKDKRYKLGRFDNEQDAFLAYKSKLKEIESNKQI